MKQLFNMDYVNNLHGANYFGCETNGQSEEQQEAIQRRWLDAMAHRGFVLDDEPTDSDEFESACMESLNEALEVAE
jgi:hypothetical protein